MTMQIGAKLPHTGEAAISRGVATLARELEKSGFDSLWVSDHIVLPTVIESSYPFAADGKATWATDAPYIEALTALSAAAAVTEHVRLGTAALVLPLRNPVLLAKQAASIDVLSGGRLCLGVGAGWLREEFDALDSPFDTRGPRMIEWIGLLRDCWTGHPAGRSTSHYTLPDTMLVLPKPEQLIPLYVAGHSPVALRRAGRLGDGWLAQQSVACLDPVQLAEEIATVRSAAAKANRDPDLLRVVLRLVDSTGRTDIVAKRLAELAGIGVDEIIIDTDYLHGDPQAECARLHDAAAST